MHKLRFKFAKGESVKYVSHLDFMRMITRALRRANLPLSYSQGFNPHPVMTVAVPLSVGVSSEGDYMDITFDEAYTDFSALMACINASLPDGFRILEIKDPVLEALEDLYLIDTGEYRVRVIADKAEGDWAGQLLDMPVIMMEKKTKSGIKDTDIRPLIDTIKLEKTDASGIMEIYMCLAAGQVNLKPELVIAALNRYIDSFHAEFLSAHRLSLSSKGHVCF